MKLNFNPFRLHLNQPEDFSECVTEYKRFREISRQFHRILPDYLSKNALPTCGKRLGVMKKNTLVLDTEDEICVIMDHCLYDYYENGINAILRYKKEHPPEPRTDQETVLKAKEESFYTLIQVEKVIPSVGILANDLLNERQYPLIDLGFSQSAVKGMVLATRILPFYDFVMTSGAALPIDRKLFLKIMDHATQEYGTENGSLIFDSHQIKDFTAYIIRSALNSRMSEHIAYGDITPESVVDPIRRQSHTGRNDPCPCGSGQKYKRCCGK